MPAEINDVVDWDRLSLGIFHRENGDIPVIVEFGIDFRAGEFQGIGAWTLDGLLRKNDLLHRVFHGIPRAATRAPARTVMGSKKNPLALRLRVGVGQQIPPFVAHAGDVQRRSGIDVHHQNTPDANIMHRLQIRSNALLGHAATKPEPKETGAGFRGWGCEACFEVSGRSRRGAGNRRRLWGRDFHGVLRSRCALPRLG